MAEVLELRCGATNIYLIRGSRGSLLLDTGWAGTFPVFCRALGEAGARLQEIRYVLITHFHPDHMGIAQEIASRGPVIAVPDWQMPFLHAADSIFLKEGRKEFLPIIDKDVRVFSLAESRAFLADLGIAGEILATPGHSEDSLSLWLDEGIVFVGDLNPLYELELHRGTLVWDTWQRILEKKPRKVYYGHARPAVPEPDPGPDGPGDKKAGRPEIADGKSAKDPAPGPDGPGDKKAGSAEPGDGMPEKGGSPGPVSSGSKDGGGLRFEAPGSGRSLFGFFGGAGRRGRAGEGTAPESKDTEALVLKIMKYADKGYTVERICRKTGADRTFAEDVMRMYMTHPGVSVQGILDRIEIKGR